MKKKVIQYQIHQILTNKNRQTEINRQLRKIETPLNQTTHNQTTQRQELKAHLENNFWEKNWIPAKSTKKKIKTRMASSTGDADKKSTSTGQNDKTKESRWNI